MIVTLLRKPLEGTVAENTLKHGCGAVNIDATRVSFEDNENINFEARQKQQADPREKGWSGHVAQVGSDIQMYKEKGRWPANFILTHKDGCESQDDGWTCVEGCPVKEIDQQSGILKSGGRSSKFYADNNSDRAVYRSFSSGVSKKLEPSTGGASRFFKQLGENSND